MPEHPIGKSFPRKEGRKKVTGQALYVDDLSFPEMLHGVTVRSPSPRGRIKNISFEGDIPWDEFTDRHCQRHSRRKLRCTDPQRPAISRRRFCQSSGRANRAARASATSICSKKHAATFASRSKSSRRSSRSRIHSRRRRSSGAKTMSSRSFWSIKATSTKPGPARISSSKANTTPARRSNSTSRTTARLRSPIRTKA